MNNCHFSDKYTSVDFAEEPHIGIRYILPSTSEEEKLSIKKYPFINKRNLKVKLKDIKDNKEYSFEIPKGYCFDGASVPRFFWRIIGSNTDNQFLIAALVHDVLCENHSYIDNDREFSTRVFNLLLKESGVKPIKRFLMKHSVNTFQALFCKWGGVNGINGGKSKRG